MSSVADRNCDLHARQGVVVIAPGSRFGGDDGLGPAVADRLDAIAGGCTIVEGGIDAMSIVNAWADAALVVVIDAAASGAPPGTIRRIETDAGLLPKGFARCSSHGLGLIEAWELGNALERIPGRLVVYAVEAATFEPGIELSAEVAQAVDRVAEQVAAEINSFKNRSKDAACMRPH